MEDPPLYVAAPSGERHAPPKAEDGTNLSDDENDVHIHYHNATRSSLASPTDVKLPEAENPSWQDVYQDLVHKHRRSRYRPIANRSGFHTIAVSAPLFFCAKVCSQLQTVKSAQHGTPALKPAADIFAPYTPAAAAARSLRASRSMNRSTRQLSLPTVDAMDVIVGGK